MRSTTQLGLAGFCLLLAGSPLAAQQPAPSGAPHDAGRHAMPHPAGIPAMDCPMMSAMMHGPAAALGAGSALELTPDQRMRLQTAQRALDAVRAPGMDSMRVIHARVMALTKQPTLDERAARAAFDRMGRVHTEVGVAMLRASGDASGILTSAQRDSLASITHRQMSKPGTMSMGAAMPMCGSVMHPSGAPHR